MRLKTLNGAPLAQHLHFEEDALIGLNECDPFTGSNIAPEPTDTASTLKWRHVRVGGSRLRTGWSQPYLPDSSGKLRDGNSSLVQVEEASTFPRPDSSPQDTTMDFDEPSTADPFLQHSLILHDTLLSSQVAQDTVADQTISSSSFLTTSFNTTISEMNSSNGTGGHTLILQLPPKMAITPLGSLPSAQRLRSIYPQTPTPNVLCVLMTPPERREVFIRKGGYNMDLYELIVADDTNSEFKVTFWLRPPRESNNEQSNAQQPLLQTLENVRVGDILLFRNIALSSFRDTVYGQSLNPGIARAKTTIDVLMKSTGVVLGKMEGLPEGFVQTFQRVKRWARTHVAGADWGASKRKGASVGRESSKKQRPTSSVDDDSLPPDTLVE